MDRVADPADQRRKGPRFGIDFMAVLEVSPDLACHCINGTIADINSAGVAALGAASRDQLVGRRLADLVGYDYASTLDDLLDLRVVEDMAFPIRVIRLDGRRIEALLHVRPARELGPGHTVVTAHDISREGHLARSARASDDRFHLLVEKSMHLIVHCHGGHIVYINAAGARLLGADDPAKLRGMPVADMFQDDYRHIFLENLDDMLAEQAMLPVRLARRDETSLDAQIMITPLATEGAVPEYMIEARDISGHLRAVAALRRMNETLETQVAEQTADLRRERSRAVERRKFVEGLLEAVPNPLWWKDINGRFQGYNLAFRDVHGIGPDDWIGKTLDETVDRNLVATATESDIRALESGQRVQFEGRVTMASGQSHDVIISKVAWSSQDDRPEGVIGVMVDITERKAMEAELRRMATTDPLTGAENRRQFMSAMKAEFVRATRHPRPMSAVMLDIDHFKRVNDTHGHPVGDEALKATAAACRKAIRQQDVLGRLGGEEFGVMLPDTDTAAATTVAERIRQSIASIVIPTESGPLSFTASVGIARMEPADQSIQDLLSRADKALYEAKRGGRNKVVVA